MLRPLNFRCASKMTEGWGGGDTMATVPPVLEILENTKREGGRGWFSFLILTR